MPGAGAHARPERPGWAGWTAESLRVSNMNPKFPELFYSKLSVSKRCLLLFSHSFVSNSL